MLTILIIIFVLIVVGTLVYFGRKFINYQSLEKNKQEENIFEELKDLKSFKLKVVPVKEMYSYFFGNMLLFISFYVVVCMIGGIIEYNGVIQPLAEGGLFFIFYLLIFVLGFWQYAFFRKAIIPNLKHGKLIQERMQKLLRLNATFIALSVWISAIFGYMTPGFFIGAGLIIFVTAFIFHFELQRAGIPNLYEGLMNLKNKNRGN